MTDETASSESEATTSSEEIRPASNTSFAIHLNRVMSPVIGLCRSFSFNSRIRIPEQTALLAEWSEELDSPEIRAKRAAGIGRAYDDAVSRGIRVEAKAVGLLQVVAIGFAIVAFVLSRQDVVLRAIALLALVFLTAATWGALEALRVRRRPQVLARSALSESDGLVETAAAAEELESLHTLSSNLLSGVLRDLAVGGAIALLALVLVGLGWGTAEDAVGGPGSNAPSPSSTTVERSSDGSMPGTSQAPSTTDPDVGGP